MAGEPIGYRLSDDWQLAFEEVIRTFYQHKVFRFSSQLENFPKILNRSELVMVAADHQLWLRASGKIRIGVETFLDGERSPERDQPHDSWIGTASLQTRSSAK